MKIINCKLIVIACSCLITSYSFFTIGDLVIFNNLISAKGVPFLLQAGWKRRNSSAGLKKEHLFAKNMMFKKEYFVVGRCCWSSLQSCFKVIQRLFEKYVVGCPSEKFLQKPLRLILIIAAY